MRLAIVGSRICTPIDIASHLSAKPDVVVSGGAAGVDTYAKEYAMKNGITLVEYLPEYEKYGRKAPILRNIQIVDNCDFLIAFWNGTSPGTKFTIDYAMKRGVPYRVVRIPSSLEYLGHAHFWRIVPADLHRVKTPSKIQPIGKEDLSVTTDTQTTPETSRFHLRLLFNVIRVVSGLW